MLTISTGELLTAYCNSKRIRKSGLARKAGIAYQSILLHLKSKTLSVDVLLKISTALEHNFLMDIAVQLPKSYTTDAPIDTTTANEIEALKEKIKLLEAEKEILLRAFGVKG